MRTYLAAIGIQVVSHGRCGCGAGLGCGAHQLRDARRDLRGQRNQHFAQEEYFGRPLLFSFLRPCLDDGLQHEHVPLREPLVKHRLLVHACISDGIAC